MSTQLLPVTSAGNVKKTFVDSNENDASVKEVIKHAKNASKVTQDDINAGFAQHMRMRYRYSDGTYGYTPEPV